MPQTPCKFFLTTPIYYVNARPHIGHAYTTIVADVLARRSRAQGTPTWFLTGTDEHGQKIERSAQAAGIPPQAFADEVSASFQTLWQRMGITNDQFIRTTDPAHKRGVQKLFADLYSKGQIYLSSYTGQYSIGEEMFVEGPPGTIGPDGKPTETVTEENFFFRLSDYQLPLLNLIESDTLKITPEARKNEVLSFLRGNTAGAPSSTDSRIVGQGGVLGEAQPLSSEPAQESVILSEGAGTSAPQSKDPEASSVATSDRPTSTGMPANSAAEPFAFSALGTPYLPGALRDLSVSRSSFTWGIPVPEPAASEAKEKHVIYVWLDALANYMTALGYGSEDPTEQAHFEKFWPADLHLVGKEIIRFHCVYWPAFLLAAGLPLPKAVTAHGWLLFDDSKMSKSRGNIVRTETILSAFGALCPPVPITSTQSPGAPSSTDGSIVGQGGASSEARPLSLSAEQTSVILSDPEQSEGESKDPETTSLTQAARPTSTGNALAAPSSPATIGKHRVSDQVRPPFPDPTQASHHAASPLLSFRSAAEESASVLQSPTPSGASDEARPHSSSPSQNSVILSDPEQSEGESKDPEELNPTPIDRPTSTGTLAPPDEVRPPSPGAPTPHQRDLFAADVLRYFLLREIPFGQDGSFTFDALITRYNADLANGYGNLVSRTLTLIAKDFSSQIPQPTEPYLLSSHTEAEAYLRTQKSISPDFEWPDAFSSFGGLWATGDATHKFTQGIKEKNFAGAVNEVLIVLRHVDGELSARAPWKMIKDQGKRQDVADILYAALESIRIITALLYPIMPYATASVWAQLGLGSIERASENGELTTLTWGGLKPGTRLGPLAPIFPRADKGLSQIMADMESQKNDQTTTAQTAPDQSPSSVKSVVSLSSEPAPTSPAAGPRTSTLAEPNPGQLVAGSSATSTERTGTPSHTEAASGIFAHQPADSSPQITIDDFAKVELRVAQVLVCERIPKADKLLRLEVDLGYEKRQILSGIAEWYTPEDLIGRRIVVITNLAPRKMRGLESHGMLLAASTEGGKPHLATFADPESLPLGSRLK